MDNSKEIWKDIDGYDGAYKISNLGNVYSVYKKGILKPGTGSQGHRYVSLYKNRKSKSYNIHRLVGEYFIPITVPYIIAIIGFAGSKNYIFKRG